MNTKTAEPPRWTGNRSKCDICYGDISQSEFVDGKTVMGPWALMCMDCFIKYGRTIGQGSGQHYNTLGIKIGG